MQTQVSPMTNRKPGRFGVLLCIFLLVGFALSFLGQPVQAQPSLAITSVSLPEAKVGSPYSATLTATGGMLPYVWAITVGTLPPGLFLDSATGIIFGVPPREALGTHTFTIAVEDIHRQKAYKSFSITVTGVYKAMVTISAGLLHPSETMVYIDGSPARKLKGRESLTVEVAMGRTPTVSIDPLVTDPVNPDRRFKAIESTLTITEAKPHVSFDYATEWRIRYRVEPTDIIPLPADSWFSEGSILTASTRTVVDGPPGTQYRFSHWRLPTAEIVTTPDLRLTVKWGGQMVAYFDTFYLLTVFSEYGTPKGSEYYKADTTASWSVTPTEVEMSGVLGFLGGKMRAKNPEGIEVMTSSKTVTISWKSDYKMPILISTLVFLFIGLASYLGYRYAQKGGAEPTIPKCGEVVKCPTCPKEFGECTLAKYPAHTQHWPVSEHWCTFTQDCATPGCGKVNECTSTCHYGEHSIKPHHPCAVPVKCDTCPKEFGPCGNICPHNTHRVPKQHKCAVLVECDKCPYHDGPCGKYCPHDTHRPVPEHNCVAPCPCGQFKCTKGKCPHGEAHTFHYHKCVPKPK